MHACAEYVLSILIFRQFRFSVIPDFRQVRFSVIPDFRQVKISVTVPSSRKLGTRISRNRPVPSRKLGTSDANAAVSALKKVLIPEQAVP